VESGLIIGALVFLLSSFLNGAYFLPIVFRALLKEPYVPPQNNHSHYTPYAEVKENFFCAIPLFITALLTLILASQIEFLYQIVKLVEVLYVD